MTKNETLLHQLADKASDERTAAARALQARGLRIVATKERDGVEVDATLDMWAYPHAVEFWGRKRLPVVDPGDVLPGKTLDLDPIDGNVLSDGYNHRSAADWKGVSPELRALVRWGVKRGRLPAVDPIGMAAQLRRGKLSPRLKVLQKEATKEELEETAAELQRVERPVPDYGPAVAVLLPSADAGARPCASRPETISSFLAGAFTAEELRRLICNICPQAINSVAWAGDMNTVAFRVVEVLKQHGVLGGRFFAALVQARPGKADDIIRLEQSGVRS